MKIAFVSVGGLYAAEKRFETVCKGEGLFRPRRCSIDVPLGTEIEVSA